MSDNDDWVYPAHRVSVIKAINELRGQLDASEIARWRLTGALTVLLSKHHGSDFQSPAVLRAREVLGAPRDGDEELPTAEEVRGILKPEPRDINDLRAKLATREQALRLCLNMVDGDGAPPDWDAIRAILAEPREDVHLTKQEQSTMDRALRRSVRIVDPRKDGEK